MVIPVVKNVTFFPEMDTVGAPTTEYEKVPVLFELGSTNVNDKSVIYLLDILKFDMVGVACNTTNDASSTSAVNMFIVCIALTVVDPTPTILTSLVGLIDGGPVTQLLVAPVNPMLVNVP